MELVFCQYDSSDCLVTLDGTATVFVSRENVVALEEAFNTLLLE